VEWDITAASTHAVKVSVLAVDKTGVLANISSSISSSEANISRAEITTREDQKAQLDFVIEITDTAHLNRVLKAVERVEDEQENLRMLYVGCTRAADYLLLTSKLKDAEKPSTQWLKFIASRFELSSGRCLAHLPAGYPLPDIRMTTEAGSGHPSSSAGRLS
jgi:predicted amino acid-binding ACT domain protein